MRPPHIQAHGPAGTVRPALQTMLQIGAKIGELKRHDSAALLADDARVDESPSVLGYLRR